MTVKMIKGHIYCTAGGKEEAEIKEIDMDDSYPAGGIWTKGFRKGQRDAWTLDGNYSFRPGLLDLVRDITADVINGETKVLRPKKTHRINKANPKDLIGVKKPRLSLVPGSFLVHVADAFRNGADKYGAYNWRDNDVMASIYIDAAERHIRAWLDGEEVAEDSKVHHLAHAGACLAILLDAQEGKNLVDDRPKTGSTSKVIDRLTKKGE